MKQCETSRVADMEITNYRIGSEGALGGEHSVVAGVIWGYRVKVGVSEAGHSRWGIHRRERREGWQSGSREAWIPRYYAHEAPVRYRAAV
jgi:hypothetical protein